MKSGLTQLNQVHTTLRRDRECIKMLSRWMLINAAV